MGNEWRDYAKLVISTLEKHSTTLASLAERIQQSEIEIATLKVKFGIFTGTLVLGIQIAVELAKYFL